MSSSSSAASRDAVQLPNQTELPSPSVKERPGQSKIRDVLSYLGPLNPFPHKVTKDDVVWLMDNVAFRGAGGTWQGEFVAATFVGKPSCNLVDVVGDIAEKLHFAKGAQEEATIERRIVPFVMGVSPGSQVRVNFNAAAGLKLGPGGRNGISSDIRSLPGSLGGSVMSSTAEVPTGTKGLLEMKTMFAEPEGWAVISDIDDTIKITMTSDPLGILRSTFVSDPTPVAGMPEFYKRIQGRIGATSPFFYLSASPYNLYPFLRAFRDASWTTIPGLLSNLTLGTQEYKVDRMKKINSWLPKRKMICIGDSTQRDPESYGEIYRTFPGWVHVILIRKVSDVDPQAKNDDNRFEDAFKGVPKSVWHVFEEPSECLQIIDSIVPSTVDGSLHPFSQRLFGFAMATSTSSAAVKRQRSSKDVPYHLIYWPGLPGRGEHIRLALEEAGAEYTDTAHIPGAVNEVLAHVKGEIPDDGINIPSFAPPILQHGALVISQTPNILLYLGTRLGLAPSTEGDDPDGLYRINSLTLTALDGLSNEPHDCHHPISTELYYEDQKEESKRKAQEYVKTRLPKFLGYFERVLGSKASGDGPWLYGGRLTYADLVLFQCVDGVKFQFPRAMAKLEREGNYPKVFALYAAVKERPKVKAYLESPRRQKYSNGIYRYYEELDFEG
ncbi:hypothetical protein QBC46DRAFT_259085 [Diplogelasinospora grovesii]|uniref:Uncharacterized protein n=1 Tax=Diplogelasinospora grovesii TaxID=303347 RepID=A0AAN6NA59_9PEZI|nr:hypothetical protein QBC46DRAFT_259085 [Diplogelasinospora grovesii]